MEYTGTYRTMLKTSEKRDLKKIAQKKGMTLTGYVDHVLREEIKKEVENGTASISK